MEELFAKYGSIAEVNLSIDTTPRKPNGFRVVHDAKNRQCEAYSESDGSRLHSRMMHFPPGKAKDCQEHKLHEKIRNNKHPNLAHRRIGLSCF